MRDPGALEPTARDRTGRSAYAHGPGGGLAGGGAAEHAGAGDADRTGGGAADQAEAHREAARDRGEDRGSGDGRGRESGARAAEGSEYGPVSRRTAMVEAVGLSRDYASGAGTVHALRGLDISVARGELLAVRGRSGSGKTTLLNVLGGLDRPTAGTIRIDGREITSLSDGDLEALRRTTVAFIFQSFGLIPFLSAAENVEVPLRLVDTESAERDARVLHLLELVGLGDRAHHRPHELSGGEQQRVAIARALANRPRVLLADEPTGQLDSETGHHIMLLLQSVVRRERVTAIVATHDPMMLDVADRVVQLSDGRLVAQADPGAGPAGPPGPRDAPRQP